MSIHPSLRGLDTLRGERSVLTRFERIARLTKEGRVKPDESSAWGLPKVRTKFKATTTKKKAEGDGAATPAAGEAKAE